MIANLSTFEPIAKNIQTTHYSRPELKDHIEEFKKVIPNLTLDKAKKLERELENRDKEYYDKIRAEVTTELESEFLAKYKDEIRNIAISAIKEIDTPS